MPPFQGITNLTLFITNPAYTMNGWLFRARDDDPAGFVSDEVQLRLPRPVVYVKANATGYHNGSDWANAFSRLDDALTAVTPGCQVWVAAGIYYPSSTRLLSEVSVFGGFSGTETDVVNAIASLPPCERRRWDSRRIQRQHLVPRLLLD